MFYSILPMTKLGWLHLKLYSIQKIFQTLPSCLQYKRVILDQEYDIQGEKNGLTCLNGLLTKFSFDGSTLTQSPTITITQLDLILSFMALWHFFFFFFFFLQVKICDIFLIYGPNIDYGCLFESPRCYLSWLSE